jgi:hypothetical protein
MVPDAFVRHRVGKKRIRLAVPSRKGDSAYFANLLERLDDFSAFDRREVNPLTGSLILEDSRLDLVALGEYAQTNHLFLLHHEHLPAEPFAAQVAKPIGAASRQIRKFTGGELDLPGAVFIGLLTFGLFEIARGNFRLPPWYTAFWYAFGVFSKSMLDRSKADTA